MFLLSRLDEVSARFPDDVEGTREFLLDRGIPAGSQEALTHFSARLAIDPSFRRDVTSLVQVVIQRENEAVDYMDLLGILVVAAVGAGLSRADDEQEESAREILRFLTQIRRQAGAVAPVFVRSQNVVPPVVVARPHSSERAPQPVSGNYDAAVRPVPSVPFSWAEESKPSRRRGVAIWITVGMGLAVALGSGWVYYQRNHATSQPLEAQQIASSSGVPVTGKKEDLSTPPAGRVWKPHSPALPAAARHLNGLRIHKADSPATEQVAPMRPTRSLDAGQSFPPVKLPPPAKPSVIAGNNPGGKPLNIIPGSASPRSTATTSVRRRLPKSVVLNPGPLRRQGESSGSLNTSAPGVVHPTSIGMMATNLISSPAPAYPAAASQARVQGEVMVRAVVDREGNVIDAHVVSGPVLLREVSLAAVQQWHYRPYIQAGKPVEVATTAVLDFELP